VSGECCHEGAKGRNWLFNNKRWGQLNPCIFSIAVFGGGNLLVCDFWHCKDKDRKNAGEKTAAISRLIFFDTSSSTQGETKA
jgi:hypothetical protein